jgi:hypothetical protein
MIYHDDNCSKAEKNGLLPFNLVTVLYSWVAPPPLSDRVCPELVEPPALVVSVEPLVMPVVLASLV